MKLLLDTHVILWWLDDDPRLGRRARNVIADDANQTLVSIASLWEVAVKHRIGKLRVRAADVIDRMEADNLQLMPIAVEHVKTIETFRPSVHNDPFDHLILAQAKIEQALLMTNDDDMRHYGVPCISTS